MDIWVLFWCKSVLLKKVLGQFLTGFAWNRTNRTIKMTHNAIKSVGAFMDMECILHGFFHVKNPTQHILDMVSDIVLHPFGVFVVFRASTQKPHFVHATAPSIQLCS